MEQQFITIDRDLQWYFTYPITTVRLKSIVKGVENFNNKINDDNYSTYNTHPNYQRPLVWTLKQKQDFVLFILRGGRSDLIVSDNFARDDIDLLNDMNIADYDFIDGQQRINALIDFYNGKFDIEFNGQILNNKTYDVNKISVTVGILNFKNLQQILQYYIDINTLGSQHEVNDIKIAVDLLEKIT